MFQIENGREHFWQWDLNQRLIVDDASINEVHFSNRTDDGSLICEVFEEDGKRLVNVPNILLQDIWDIRVYAYCVDYTKIEEKFKVYKRGKPADYVYTETEIKDYDDLKARVDEIERNGVSQEAVNAAVSDYLTKHPIETGATPEEAAQIEANKNAIAQLETNKATKEYVDTAVAAINIPTKVSAFENDAGYLTQHQSLDDYALKSYVEEAISAIPQPDLSSYALKTEIPDVSNLATKAEISGFITEIPAEYVTETELNAKGYLTEIPTEYVTDSELEAKGYLTEHQSLGNYYTKAETNNLIPDVSGFALKTEIPDVSGYQTEAQVIALIQANMPASGDEVSY